MRLDQQTKQNVDTWRAEQVDVPSRAEAMRRLVDLGLSTKSKKQITFSDGENLTLILLIQMFKHLKIKSDFDVDLIEKSLLGGHYWALELEHSNIFHGHDDMKVVQEVVDVLDMWMFIEDYYEELGKEDKVSLEKNGSIAFNGFSGNEEGEYISIAQFLIEDLDRYTMFKGRHLNSHFPNIDVYRRMLKVFEPMGIGFLGRSLNASQMAEILNEQTHPDNR